mgnify:CR=1 FL=1
MWLVYAPELTNKLAGISSFTLVKKNQKPHDFFYGWKLLPRRRGDSSKQGSLLLLTFQENLSKSFSTNVAMLIINSCRCLSSIIMIWNALPWMVDWILNTMPLLSHCQQHNKMIIMIHNDNYINVSMSVYKLNLVSNKLHDIIPRSNRRSILSSITPWSY